MHLRRRTTPQRANFSVSPAKAQQLSVAVCSTHLLVFGVKSVHCGVCELSPAPPQPMEGLRRMKRLALCPADIFLQWRLWYYAIMGFLVQAVLAGCIFFVPLIVDAMFSGERLDQSNDCTLQGLPRQAWPS